MKRTIKLQARSFLENPQFLGTSRFSLSQTALEKGLWAKVCAVLTDLSPNSGLLPILELGLSEWALARCEATDEQYTQRLRNAETCLLDALLTSFEPGKLALARLYRLTFRPWDACQTFSQLLPRAENLRRLLRDAYIYGEAAVQLWYADYPKSITNHYLSDAKALLENAIAADYHNARMIMALAFVKAILEGPSEGRIALTEICTGEKEVSWKDVCRILAEKASTPNTVSAELVTEGFALGIEQSAIWTRLGTFSLKFLADEQLAEALYEVAVRLDPRDAIAHTNYARFLVAKGDDVSLRKAERELQKAQNFADRRFTGWKAILADLANKLGKQSHTKVIHTQKLQKPTRAIAALRDLDQIRDRFRTAKKMGNPQQRGYELEQLIFQVAKLTFGTAAPPYRLLRTEGAISQIDGYFEHRGEKYRVECKWESQPADHNHIIQFSDKLEVVGISGLFIAMAGFTASAVQRAKELRSTKVIILMDGNEAEAIFKGHFTFDEVLTRKRLHFDQLSDPYHRIVSAPDVA